MHIINLYPKLILKKTYIYDVRVAQNCKTKTSSILIMSFAWLVVSKVLFSFFLRIIFMFNDNDLISVIVIELKIN